MSPSRWAWPCLLATLAVALLLRVPGLGWGLPCAEHHLSFHPDEYNVLRVLAAYAPERLSLNPRYFHNPPLYYNLCGIAYVGALAAGLIGELDAESWHDAPQDVGRFYLLGRSLSVLAGILTVGVLFVLAEGRQQPLRGTLAALLVVTSPAHIVLSQYMDVDVLLTLWIACTLLLCDRFLESGQDRARRLAAIVVGLAMATKYNGVLALIPLIVAIALQSRHRLRHWVEAVATSGATYLVMSPYTVLDPRGFAAGLRYVLTERVRGRWSTLDHGLEFPLVHTWPWLLHEVGLLLLVLATAAAVLPERRRSWPALGLLLAVYGSAALSGTDYVRYSLPALPALAVILTEQFRFQRARRWMLLLLGLPILLNLARSQALLRLMIDPDVREQASIRLERELPAQAAVVVPREPYFFSPPRIFMDYHYQGRSTAWRSTQPGYRVVNAEWSTTALEAQVTWVVLSEHELLYPAASASATGHFLRTVMSSDQFVESWRLDRPARFGSWQFEADLPGPGWPYDGAQAQRLRDRRLPHDLKYLNPAILVFRHRALTAPTEPP